VELVNGERQLLLSQKRMVAFDGYLTFTNLTNVSSNKSIPFLLFFPSYAIIQSYAFFIKLDISMQFCTFMLDEESQWLCVIVTPCGNYKYLHLPMSMGVKQSPDIAQENMEDILHDIDEAKVDIDDIGIFTNDCPSHLQALEKVLTSHQDNGFTITQM